MPELKKNSDKRFKILSKRSLPTTQCDIDTDNYYCVLKNNKRFRHESRFPELSSYLKAFNVFCSRENKES